MGIKWYFDTIEEAKAAMPDWDKIFTTAPNWDVNEDPVGKFAPTSGYVICGPRCLNGGPLCENDDWGWTVVERRGESQGANQTPQRKLEEMVECVIDCFDSDNIKGAAEYAYDFLVETGWATPEETK